MSEQQDELTAEERIDRILETIRIAWKVAPDLRLCQLIGNCFPAGDNYYKEDDDLVAQLAKSQEVCPDCNSQHPLYKALGGIGCPTCKGTGLAKRLDRPALREKIAEVLYKYASRDVQDFIDEFKVNVPRKPRKWEDKPEGSLGKEYWYKRADLLLALFSPVYSNEELERKIALEALAGTHRVIPCFKEYCDGEPIDAYLTSASITKILKNILALIPDVEEIRKQAEDDILKGNPETGWGRLLDLVHRKEIEAKQEEKERIISYLRNHYGGVGTNASRKTAYRIAKSLAIDLTLEDVNGQALKESS